MASQIYYVRHGETAWSKSGQHTGRTDLPLTENGRLEVRWLAGRLASVPFSHVITSPALRARTTCEAAGLLGSALVDPELSEWDYGDYEGLRTAEILRERPGWNLFRYGCPNGETPDQISERADRVISRLGGWDGNVALFSHGHFGRVLAARWIGLPAAGAAKLLLDAASLSILGFEHSNKAEPVLTLWNENSIDGGSGSRASAA